MVDSVSRREVLHYLIPGGVSAAAGIAKRSDTELPVPSPDAVAMLYDATKYIGCMACVNACAEANDLRPDIRAAGLHQAPMDLNEFIKNIIKLHQPVFGHHSTIIHRAVLRGIAPKVHMHHHHISQRQML